MYGVYWFLGTDQFGQRSQESMGLMGVDMKFLNPDKGEGLPDAPVYDLIVTMDAVHDMARPDLIMPLVRKVWSLSQGFLDKGCCLVRSGPIKIIRPGNYRDIAGINVGRSSKFIICEFREIWVLSVRTAWLQAYSCRTKKNADGWFKFLKCHPEYNSQICDCLLRF